MKIRRANERGYADHGWLKSFHTFSFADYRDPAHMGFRALRVINEDRVAPGNGFGKHGHRDMEILSYVLEGELSHADSMGTGSVIRPGEVQRMSAGTGVMHSEKNASETNGVHFLQIWIMPDRPGHAPGYEQTAFPKEERQGKLRLVASSDGREGSVTVHQDVSLFAGLFAAGERATYALAPGRHAWLHVARGAIDLGGTRLQAGDAAAIDDPGPLEIAGVDGAEVLLFDLALADERAAEGRPSRRKPGVLGCARAPRCPSFRPRARRRVRPRVQREARDRDRARAADGRDAAAGDVARGDRDARRRHAVRADLRGARGSRASGDADALERPGRGSIRRDHDHGESRGHGEDHAHGAPRLREGEDEAPAPRGRASLHRDLVQRGSDLHRGRMRADRRRRGHAA